MTRSTSLFATSAFVLAFAVIRGFVLLNFFGAILFSLFGAGSVYAIVCAAVCG